MNRIDKRSVRSKLEHYRDFLKDKGLPHEHLLSDNKVPWYLRKHHEQAYLRLGLPNNKPSQPRVISSAINFDNSVITRAFYIFMTMMAVVIILAALSFGLREYLLNLRRRQCSGNSCNQKFSEWNLSQLKITKKDDDMQSLSNVIQDGEKIAEDSGNADTGLTKFNDGFMGSDKSQSQFGLRRFDLESRIVSAISTISDKNSSANTGGFSDKSITKYRKKYMPLLPNLNERDLTAPETKKYSLEEMLKLNVIKTSNISYGQAIGKQKLRMSKLISSSVALPATRFRNAWNASRMISEIKVILSESQCTMEKTLAALQLCSIGRGDTLLDNPNIFLHAFNECIEELVDSSSIFDTLANCPVTLKVLIFECLFTYCWSHNKILDYESRYAAMKEQFRAWNIHSPSVQSKTTIFKILCNLQLGMYTVGTENDDCEFKLGLLTRTFIFQSMCNDYINYIPLITRAVELANRDEIVYFFFQITKLLVAKHRKCCMNEIIQDPSLELKALIESGIQSFHSERVRRKAYEIYETLLEDHSVVQAWNIELNSEEKSMMSPLPLSSEYVEKYFTPTIPEAENSTEKELPQLDNDSSDSWKTGLWTNNKSIPTITK
ncbi:uncharacterized protein LODBEIA_P42880 [Lodderomyces beijingensis]|uniref:Uncharacterized protein n=1 Tax=Lodderomyces beijingensis TaxID=1775926 RepID=A0ABP0ZPJ5_9ASCO